MGPDDYDMRLQQQQSLDDKALEMFATALNVGSKRSVALSQLLEVTHKALAVGETHLDGIRLDGLRVTDEEVEVGASFRVCGVVYLLLPRAMVRTKCQSYKNSPSLIPVYRHV